MIVVSRMQFAILCSPRPYTLALWVLFSRRVAAAFQTIRPLDGLRACVL